MKKYLVLILIIIALPVAIFLVSKTTNFFNRASGVSANLVIDAGSSYVVPTTVWRNLAQGGEEKGRMLQPVVGELKKLYPEYIRIDHVFDNYDLVSKNAQGQIQLNWTKLDETLSDIRAVGALPFISLSYMPPALTGGSIVANPTNWSDWEYLVQATIEHISGKKGLNLTGVYYEVWNEPDLFGSYKIGRDKNYLDLYYHSAMGASRATNVDTYKFGGPATTALYQSWVDGLAKFVVDNHLRMDFYSWHRYSTDLSVFEKDYTDAATWLAKYPTLSNTELIVSEMGPNSENDPAYDNYFGAIHALATLTLLENDTRRAFTFEIKDGPGDKQYWGRWGLLTNEKFGTPVEKPRFKALQFLNRMVGNKVNVAGEGSFVKSFARNDGKIIRTFVVNYDPKGAHSEAVPMTFINLPQGSYKFTRTDFSGKVNVSTFTNTSGTFSTVQVFTPNTAAIFELTKLL